MRRTRINFYRITSIVQTTISKLSLAFDDLATVIPLRYLPHTYQQLYHACYQQPIHHQEGMERYSRSNHLVEEEKGAETSDLEV